MEPVQTEPQLPRGSWRCSACGQRSVRRGTCLFFDSCAGIGAREGDTEQEEEA